MKKIKWKKKKQLPEGEYPDIVVLRYKHRQWYLSIGNFDVWEQCEKKEKVVFNMDCWTDWDNINKWCYLDEFMDYIKETF